MAEQNKIELFQNDKQDAGVELRDVSKPLYPRYATNTKPLRLTLFANTLGTFEASYDLTREEAEAMRDWLVDFLEERRDA